MTHEMALSIIKQETQEQTADRIVELYQVISEYAEQRDRLRKALEKIASMPLSASWQQHFFDATEIAQAALREENSTEEQFVSVADRLNARQETIHTNLPGQRRAEAERMEEK